MREASFLWKAIFLWKASILRESWAVIDAIFGPLAQLGQEEVDIVQHPEQVDETESADGAAQEGIAQQIADRRLRDLVEYL